MKWLESIGDYKAAAKLKSKTDRLAMNYCIQGEAGSITKYAVVLLYEYFQNENLLNDVSIVLLVHDEIVIETTLEYSELVREKLQYFMEKAGSLWCKRVSLKAEAVLDSTWNH